MKKVPKFGITFFALFVCLHSFTFAEDFFGVEIHGFASQGYLRTTEYDNYLTKNSHSGSWEYNEVGLNVQKDLLDNLRIGMQLFARDLGVQGNNDLVIDWALLDYRYKDWLGLRIGKIKTPMGFYNQGRDVDMLRTSIILPQGLYNEPTREAQAATQGVSLYGNYDFGKAGSIEYEIYLGSVNVDGDAPFIQGPYQDAMNGAAAGVASGLGQAVPGATATAEPISVSFDMKYVFGGMLIYNSPIEGLRAAMTYLEFKGDFVGSMNVNVGIPSPMDPSGSTTLASIIPVNFNTEIRWRLWIAGLDYQYNNFSITGEYYQRLWLMNDRPGKSDRMDGGFHIISKYRFTDWFELGAYYALYWMDLDDKDGKDIKAAGGNDYEAYNHDICITGRFDINEYWLFKAEIHFFNGTGIGLSDLDPVDSGSKEDWMLFALKTTVSF